MNPSKVLVTGGAGNIGSALVRGLLRIPETEVVVVDNLSTGSREKIPAHSRVTFVRADVNEYADLAAVMLHTQFDVVFHYAAVVGVERTLRNPLTVFRDIDGIRNILHLSKSTRVQRIFFSSSSEVYGEPVEIPQREASTPLNSRLPYAIVKNLGEALCRAYCQEHGLSYTVLRLFNTYGPQQSEDFVVPRFVKAALRNEDIQINGDGLQTRTFCYIDDNVAATLAMISDEYCINETVNVGSDEEISILDLARTILHVANSRSRIVHVSALSEGDMRRRCPDAIRMKSILARPLTSLESGLRKMIEAFTLGKR